MRGTFCFVCGNGQGVFYLVLGDEGFVLPCIGRGRVCSALWGEGKDVFCIMCVMCFALWVRRKMCSALSSVGS